MTLGQTKTEALQQNLKPGVFKSDAEKTKDGAEEAVRKVTGNANPHDALRQDASALPRAFEPSGSQSTENKLKQEADKIGSKSEDNANKSMGQQARDFLTPGNDSVGNNSAGISDTLGHVKDKIIGNEA
ncbi:uncharacterized protein L203_106044 [Cryptococcus depauperatus CBS 7841]|uniref:Uncharacterized protein n=1 Tax=Cryptococcus depauperatus CBS 7841 TaxID=1295531 RepID=A0A1E3IV27_9TREE|nr:hypothetical protein L203_00750 [Cryptococcus depauperatus CBS 7841]